MINLTFQKTKSDPVPGTCTILTSFVQFIFYLLSFCSRSPTRISKPSHRQISPNKEWHKGNFESIADYIFTILESPMPLQISRNETSVLFHCKKQVLHNLFQTQHATTHKAFTSVLCGALGCNLLQTARHNGSQGVWLCRKCIIQDNMMAKALKAYLNAVNEKKNIVLSQPQTVKFKPC